MNDIDKLKSDNKNLKAIVFNLLDIIEEKKLFSFAVKKTPQYQNITNAIHELQKGD
ncbi:hypothetical protein [Leptospira harrisiae]|uniref:hypothetical protein n=1 Tax=Leptospira harrisiae TaxID=2023189 RepID=UPI0013FE3061|nr:hypothetical protein [Leptospira harrisiae]